LADKERILLAGVVEILKFFYQEIRAPSFAEEVPVKSNFLWLNSAMIDFVLALLSCRYFSLEFKTANFHVKYFWIVYKILIL